MAATLARTVSSVLMSPRPGNLGAAAMKRAMQDDLAYIRFARRQIRRATGMRAEHAEERRLPHSSAIDSTAVG